MLNTLRQQIAEHLAASKSPVLMCSFGKDSMLLLSLLREVCPKIPVIWFHSDLLPQQRQFAEKVIRQWGLTVFNWPVVDLYPVSNGEGIALVQEFMIGPAVLPVVSDFERSHRCLFDAHLRRLDAMDYGWDVTFVGSRATDSHYVTGANPVANDFTLGETRIVAPLRDLSDNQVWELIVELGVPYDEQRYLGDTGRDTSAKHFCTRCLEGPTVCPKTGEFLDFKWDKQTALTNFRTRFGFNIGANEPAGNHPQ